MRKIVLALSLFFFVQTLFAGDSVVVNPAIHYQTIKGWGGEGGQNTQYEGTPPYLISQIINESVNSLGLTGLRYESWQGLSSLSYGQQYTWEWTNDNGSPDTLVPAALDTLEIDYYMKNLFVPWKNKVVANGDSFNFYFSPSWYISGSTGDIPAFLRYSPGEYAEYYISNLNYLKNKYGLVANYATMCNEAGNGNVFTPQLVGTMIKTVAPRMLAAGLPTTIQFPECVNAQTSWQYIQAEAADTGVWRYVTNLSYHLYGTNDPYRAMIDSFALSRGLITSQREYIGLGIDLLYQDLTLGGVSYWDFYGNGDYMPLNTNQTWFTYGAKYWTTRQVIHYNRPGCVRVSAVSNDTMLRVLSFTKNNTTSLVIINTTTGNVNQSVRVSGMVPGTYGYSQTSGSGTHTELGLLTVAANGTVTVAVNANMVVALYPHITNLPPLPVSWAASPAYLESPATSVALSASAQDPELSTVSYHWTVDSMPAGASVTFSNANISNPTANGMSLAGDYVFNVAMSDTNGNTTNKQVTVMAFGGNQAPILSSLQGRIPVIVTLPVDTTILHGYCYDLEGDALTYQWSVVSQPSGASAQLATPTAAITCAVRNMTVAGDYVFKYSCSDPTHTVSREITVPVFPVNDTPYITSVSATPPVVSPASGSSTLSAVTGDPNSDIITHWWTIVSTPAGAAPVFTWQGERTTGVNGMTVPGTYVFLLTVIDRTLYTARLDTVTVVASSCPSLSVSTTDAACGHSNGTATVLLTGGTGPFTYAWSSGGSTIARDSSLASGNYTVTVTSTGCSVTASGMVGSTPGPTATLSTAATTCGDDNGSARAIASGGTGPYTYLWSNAATDSTIANLVSGSYTVTVRDANGCSYTTSATVAASAGVAFSTASTATTCGADDGFAQVTITNPSNPVYHWSDNRTTDTIGHLSPGTYIVTVTSGGCTATDTVSVAPSAALMLSTSVLSASCDSSNGSASVSVISGAGPYTYDWSGGGGSAATAHNLAAGSYTVTVSGGGCIATAPANVSNTGGPAASITAQMSPSCAGDSNGSVTVAASGGTGSLSYAWSSGQGGPTITGLYGGAYTVTVQDANHCKSILSDTLAAPAPLSISYTVINDSCHGDANGCITVVPSGGTQPYIHAWSDGVSMSQNCSLPAGTYSDTVTDQHGCTVVDAAISISQPAPLSIGISDHSGTLVATVSGGTSPYSYSWDHGYLSDTAQGAVGQNVVTVTDHYGCMDTAVYTLLAVKNIAAGISSFTVYPNPSDGLFMTNILMEAPTDIIISVTDAQGRKIEESMVRNAKDISKPLDLRDRAKGTYIVILKSHQGTESRSVVTE
jgi:hypothetical protein